MERWERVLFDFNYYKCCSCDITQYRRLFDRFGGTNVVGIKKDRLWLFFLPLQYRMSHIMNWTIQQAKEITQRAEKKRKILAMRWKHVFIFRYTIEILISRHWLKSSLSLCSSIVLGSKKNFSKRSFWSIYFKAQADCSVRLFIWVLLWCNECTLGVN